MIECRVDDCIRDASAGAQAFEIFDAAALDGSSRGLECRGGRVRAGEPGNDVPGGKKLFSDDRADPAGGSGNENAHLKSL